MGMFNESKFDGDLSEWDVSNVWYMQNMFKNSVFNGDISTWDVSNVETMRDMFRGSKFDGDLSYWYVKKGCVKVGMFIDSPLYRNKKKQPHFAK